MSMSCLGPDLMLHSVSGHISKPHSPPRSLTNIMGVQETTGVCAERAEGWVGESLGNIRKHDGLVRDGPYGVVTSINVVVYGTV
jgi:hypothetical protein